MNKFYNFGPKLYLTTVYITPELDSLGLISTSLESGNLDLPIVFIQQNEGKKWSDILDTRTVDYFYVISDNFADLITENGFTGCRFVPIKLIGLANQEVNGYKGLIITGKSGVDSYKHSQVIEKSLIPNGRLWEYYKGIEVTDWDGSDFFVSKNSRRVSVTQKVRDCIFKNRLSNVCLEDLDVMEVSKTTIDDWLKKIT